ncbi:MAG: helix-hairpin-helix domain-containing protein [Victivallaceae bacterium]|nr:helix-hairpin-helix domain-containing protein [Victivallaceae bacterium]
MEKCELEKLTLDQLTAEIEHHNRLYWELHSPEISDDQYDALLIELRRRVPGHPLLEAVHAVNAETAGGKIKLAEPMLSLDKAYSLDEVVAWAEKCVRDKNEPLLVQPKYDGISAYFDGRILATRGDGTYGEDITDKIPLIELESPGYTGPLDRPARGELVIRDDDFSTIYRNIVKRGGGAYKNSRNAVAGIMGLKDISDMVRQHAKITLADYGLKSHKIRMEELTGRFADLVAEVEALPYPTDGVVFKLADAVYSDSLGATSHHPRGQIAFKFSGIRRETELVGVEWSFGKSALTPVAELSPVEIGGVTIRRATLHNAQNIIDMDLQLHDIVTVERAGDVIPYIVSREAGSNRRNIMIDRCPGCGSPLVRKGPELCCVNPECFETNLQKLADAVKNFGIERLGEPTLRKMMTALRVRTLADIFRLTKAEILTLDSFADKSAANLAAEIESARTAPDYRFLAALNIPHIGLNVAKVLLRHYPLEKLSGLSADELKTVPSIGDERARAVSEVLHAEAPLIAELLAAVDLKRTALESAGDVGRPTVCFTGKMPEKRSYYEELAAKHGYAAADSVTSSLSLLVTDDIGSKSSKTVKAKKLGVKIMELPDFLTSLEKTPVNDAAESGESAAEPVGAGAAPENNPDDAGAAPENKLGGAGDTGRPEQLELF